MTAYPHVPLDLGLIGDIEARMELRTPNVEALTRTAEAFDGASGEPFEVVCDLATAVGKTYLAGGLIEYLAASGIRNFLVVTPGRTILSKTVNNFTEGHPKSILGGRGSRPVVVTAENFNTGAVASALHDDSQVKLFVFTIGSLIRPDKATRRVRKHQEWLGEDLYQYMRDCGDLVVLSDEHHVYSEKAKAFSAAIRELNALGLVGLTATPAKSDLDKVIYHYPLARAIADRYVKTPVLVGRKDNATDVETRLRDGLLLLAAKQTKADDYASATGQRSVNAVMFVVADTIDNANAVADILRKPGMFEHDYEKRVLVIHSDAAEDALARLDAVEEPNSDVRVIVSVSMLKEGWDVKNIFVICSLRPSISDVLTEQTLGRGLRLPWGKYTDVDLLDTVEVLSHERYEELLSKAGALLEGLTEERVLPAVTAAPALGGDQDTVNLAPALDGAAGQPQGVPSGVPGEPAIAVGSAPEGAASPPELVVTSMAARELAAAAQVAAVSVPVRASVTLTVPKVTRTVTARSFELSTVGEAAFTTLGQQLAAIGGTSLNRKRLDVVADPSVPAGYRLVPTEAETTIQAAPANLPFSGATGALQDAICQLDPVTGDRASVGAAKRLANAVVAGAGGEEALAPHLSAAIAACRRIVLSAYKASPEVVSRTVQSAEFAPMRTNTRPIEENRFGPFSTKVAYAGWEKSTHGLEWFDSTPERTLANLLDDRTSPVTLWARIQRGELVVEWAGGRYNPDFYATIDGKHFLLEVKADNRVSSEEVQAKKKAAEEWARFVTDDGDYGDWLYVLVPEAVLATAKTIQAVLGQTATT